MSSFMRCPVPWQRPCSFPCSWLAVPGGTVNVTVMIRAIFAALVVATFGSGTEKAVLWHTPERIGSRDMVWGLGGREHAPHGPFRFVKEDPSGSNPKFNVVDAQGVKWKVKLGQEAKPETAASRFVWAAGFYTGEYYYLPHIQVTGLPAEL